MNNDKFVTQGYYSAGRKQRKKENRLQKQWWWNATQVINNIQIYAMDLLLFRVKGRHVESADVPDVIME